MRFNNFWEMAVFSPEDGGGGGSGDGGDSGGDPAAAGGDDSPPVSLRAQLAAGLPDAERQAFEKWANSYTDDAAFTKGAWSMRQGFDARVPVPSDKSEAKDWSAYFERVGKPPEAKAYTYDWGKGEDGKPNELSDADTARFEEFKAFAHEHHYTQSQFEAGVKFWDQMIEKDALLAADASKRFRDQAEKDLKAQWGPDYEDNLTAAQDVGILYAEDQESWAKFVNLQIVDGMRIGDHPAFLGVMAKIGRAHSEDTRVRQMHSSGEAESIQAQIAAIEQEAQKAGAMTSSEPYHSRLNALYQKLYPKKHSVAAGFGAR